MTAPPRAIVRWKDRRPQTTVYLKAMHKISHFTHTETVWWYYADVAGKHIGPEKQTTREWAWTMLKAWAEEREAGATPFPVPEDRVERDEVPALVDDDEGNPREIAEGL